MYEPPNPLRAALTNITVTARRRLGHFHFHVSSLTPLADGCVSGSGFAPALRQRGLPLSVINRTTIRPNPVRRTANKKHRHRHSDDKGISIIHSGVPPLTTLAQLAGLSQHRAVRLGATKRPTNFDEP